MQYTTILDVDEHRSDGLGDGRSGLGEEGSVASSYTWLMASTKRQPPLTWLVDDKLPV